MAVLPNSSVKTHKTTADGRPAGLDGPQWVLEEGQL
jgi:hypothetical protein